MTNTENRDLILHLSSDEPDLHIDRDSSDTSSVRSVEAVFNVDELTVQNKHSSSRNNNNHTHDLLDICENKPNGKHIGN